MRNVLVVGGTDGFGRAAAFNALSRGHRVVVVGSIECKAADFLRSAVSVGVADRAEFVQADLRLVAENARVLDLVRDRFDRPSRWGSWLGSTREP